MLCYSPVLHEARDEPLRDKGGTAGFGHEAEARRSEKFGSEVLLGFLRERQDRTGYTAQDWLIWIIRKGSSYRGGP